jgi:capsular exopolysaccharide synthesis family protein
MRNVELTKLLPARATGLDAPASRDTGFAAPPLLAVLLRRWRALAATILVCLLGAAAFLAVATRTYRASATLYVQPAAARVLADAGGAAPAAPETYLQTQADVIRSTPVLVRALEAVHYEKLRTFAAVEGNPALWLGRNRLGVDVVKRSDVITVSMDSPYPDEAAAVVEAVVNAYVAEQSQTAGKSAAAMVRVLEAEREKLLKQRAAAQEKVLAAQRERGEPAVRDGKGNLMLGRLDNLSGALTAAEVATLELKAQQEATLNAMGGPEELHAYVEGLQFRGRDQGDREYDELRSQLVQYQAQMTALSETQGFNHPRIRSLRQTVEDLKRKITAKEESIAGSQLSDVTARLEAAQQKEADLRKALEAARNRALDLGPGAAALARLEADVLEVEKRCEMLDRRMAELNLNSADAGLLNVRVLQPAMVPDRPVKPNKPLTLAAALLVGCVLGIGFATLREWQDARLRTPDEIPALLGVPLVGAVPQINRSLSPAERGQVLKLDSRSPVAEAYRSLRASLYLGDARSAKTILLASPSRGDGKSTTAANLAIAFAQAGERTLLLDCDLRDPVQHLVFGMEPTAGVSTAMPGETKLQDAVVPTRVPNLYLLPCGPVPRHPSEMLASDRFKFLLKTLCEVFDRVIIDSPPLEEVADGRILAAAADATVLVLRMNRSMQRSGVLAVSGLNEVGANVLGAVANDVRTVAAWRADADWQYAVQRADALPAPSGTGAASIAGGSSGSSNGSPNGNGHATLALPRNGELKGLAPLNQFSAEVINVAEPNWPAEKP